MKNVLIILILIAAGYFAFHKFIGSDIPSEYDAILFSADQCPACEDAAELLVLNDVLFLEYNISDSEENMALFKKQGGHSFPLIIFDDQRIEGYDEALLQAAINDLFEYESANVIELYSSSSCGWCDKARQFFQTNGIEFDEYNIDASEENRAIFKKHGGRGVPLIFIGSNRIEGYNEKAMKAALKKNNLM